MQKFIKQNKGLSWLIGIGIIVVLYLYLGPQDTPTKTVTHTATTTSKLTKTATIDVSDDESAHFPKYIGASHDPFIPGVAIDNPGTGGAGNLVNGKKWVLTGINSINGVTSAVMENTDTNLASGQNQSVFLQVGDTWDGMRVASITDDSVNLVNLYGKVTQLGFPVPSANPSSPAGNAGAQYGGGSQGFGQFGGGQGFGQAGGGQGFGQNGQNAPALNQVAPLPALSPDDQQAPAQGFGRRGRRQQSN
jgi:hypothetical protein